jgi:hypothetical protein
LSKQAFHIESPLQLMRYSSYSSILKVSANSSCGFCLFSSCHCLRWSLAPLLSRWANRHN